MKTMKLYILLTFGCGLLLAAGCSTEDSSLSTSVQVIELPAALSNATFSVYTGADDWRVTSDSEWLTVSKISGTRNIKVSALENDAIPSHPRTAIVTCTAGSQAATVQVIQAAYSLTQSDSLTLALLYTGASGYSWNKKWALTTPFARWEGVTVENGRVTKLQLPDNNVAGALPDALYSLTELRLLDLSGNKLTGTLSSSISNLNKLIYLDVSKNELTGAIPSMSSLTGLKVLDVSENKFTAGATPALTQLTALEYLALRHTGITGALPDLGALTQLNTVDLSHNALTGAIPTGWSSLKKMRILYLYNNALSGTIPAFTDFHSLDSLALDGNQFTGGVPDNFVNVTPLTGLWLEDNQLTGTISNALLTDTRWLRWHICKGNTFSNCTGDSSTPVSGFRSSAVRPSPSKAAYRW